MLLVLFVYLLIYKGDGVPLINAIHSADDSYRWLAVGSSLIANPPPGGFFVSGGFHARYFYNRYPFPFPGDLFSETF